MGLQNNRNSGEYQDGYSIIDEYYSRRREVNQMMKIVPLRKQSKKYQREYFAKRRGSWNGVNPITRVAKSKKEYDRNRIKQRIRKNLDE